MSNAKHTPGPWFSPERSFGTRYVEARVGGGMLQEVAACGPTEAPEQQEANARLIAAAPELLQALIDLMPETDYFIPANPSQKPGIEAARAAIAKATGATE